MENLASSLSGKFKTLRYTSSEASCIYRVPQTRRRFHPSDYTPIMVSIGPLHHGKQELKPMEEHKLRYLHHFLQRTQVSMAHFLAFIQIKETKLRNYYADTIDLESDDFITMILVDAVFLIELFLRNGSSDFITDDDPLFDKSMWTFLTVHMRFDLYLEENQLPFFILSELFDLAKTKTRNGDIYMGISLMTFICKWFSAEPGLPKINAESLTGVQFSEVKHFLDLVILCLHSPQPPESRAQSKFSYRNMPGAKELYRAGVEFKDSEIPFFCLFDITERVYRNLLMFENMHVYPVKYFNDYIILMSSFLVTPKDADLLVQNEIIGLGDSELLSTVFHSLVKDCVIYNNFQYTALVEDLQAFCKSPAHRWKAILDQNYFNTPWSTTSVIAAVILLLLTATQTICSIIAL
ncbi:hypothetical protein CICLE_v10015442mg [Citrus x clementina]|uniref:Uncharacterized protein n=2 Tax=Citrus TaxID=2706 RepID=V4UAR5_CITCL|nr:hypothetical protein CICLE_v10015442mg [Citrus x clementina]